MSITLYQFNLLADSEQAEYLWATGVHIDDRMAAGCRILLYQVDSFYVEVYYNAVTNHIDRLRSFCSTDVLEPYLEKIDALSLLNGSY